MSTNPDMIKESSKEINQLKTICEYLIPDRFQEIADFTRFEICLKPLFSNIPISIKSIFDIIVSKKRKYITYGRFLEAYHNYKNNLYNQPENKDINIFFEKLMTSILKTGVNYIGTSSANNYSSKNFSNDKKYSISRLVLLCDQDRKIFGAELRYNDAYNIRLAPRCLIKALEIKLDILIEMGQNYKLRDGITHIFGTINSDKYITFLGFKCISGTTKCFGVPNGEGFLFGEFGQKLQCIGLNQDDNGINRIELLFTKNPLINTNFNINLETYDKDKIYYDEDLLKLNNTEESIEKIRRTQILGKKNDYIQSGFLKALVQTPLSYLMKKNENEKNDELKDKKTVLAKCRQTNSTIIMNTSNNYKENTISQNPFIPLLEQPKKYGGVARIPNPFYSKKPISVAQNNFFRQNKNSNITTIGGNPFLTNKTNIKKQVKSIKSFRSKKEEIQSNYLEMKENLVNNIYKQVKEKCGGEIDMETEIALNKILEAKESKDEEKTKEEKKEDDTTEEEKKEEKKLYTEALIEKLGLKKNKEEANKVLLNLMNKNEGNSLQKLKTIEEEDEDNINNLGKTIIQINDKKNESIPNQEVKPENTLLDNIKLLDELKNFKVDKNAETQTIDEKPEEEDEEDDNEDEELEEEEPINENINQVSINQKMKFIENCNTIIQGNELNQEERKEMEEAIRNDQQNLNNMVNEEKNKNRLSLRRANGLKIDNWEERMEEERQKKIKEESKKLLENYANNSESKKKKINYKIFKSIHSETIYNKNIHNKQKPPQKLKKWVDKEFRADKHALCDAKKFKKVLVKKCTNWIRPNEFNNMRNYCVFINNKPDINNIKQGKINDCYFLSAVGALCDKCNTFFKGLFHVTEKTYEHAYGINFYIKGRPKLFLVDDYFPCNEIRDKKTKIVTKNFCFGSSFENEIWVPLIEKAWAKLKGNYAEAELGKAMESFEALTGAFTYQIKVKNIKNKDELWNTLKKYNDFPMCAGSTKNTISCTLPFKELGLKEAHEYTLMLVYHDVDERRVLLRDPYGIDNKSPKSESIIDRNGMFSISFEDFLECFHLIEIAFFKEDFKRYPLKIKKEQALRCQFIEINNEYEDNILYINLYQNNPIINKKNGQKPVYGYIMLIQCKEINEKGNSYIYITSKTSLNKEGEYDSHLAINEIKLEKGKYFLCCDVNYRFLDEGENIHGYNLNIFSTKELTVKNLTETIDGAKIFQETFIKFIKGKKDDGAKKEKTPEGIQGYSFSKIELFPFDIYYFKNKDDSNETKIIQFEIINKKKEKEKLCVYNDDEINEFEKKFTKLLEPKQKKIVLIMHYEYSNKDKNCLKFEEIKNKPIAPIFASRKIKGTKNVENKIVYYLIETPEKFGHIVGFQNISNSNLKLNIKMDKCFNTNYKEWNYENEDKIFHFELLPKGTKVFNLRKKILKKRKKGEKVDYKYFLDIDK